MGVLEPEGMPKLMDVSHPIIVAEDRVSISLQAIISASSAVVTEPQVASSVWKCRKDWASREIGDAGCS
jgi:hypothetical protein